MRVKKEFPLASSAGECETKSNTAAFSRGLVHEESEGSHLHLAICNHGIAARAARRGAIAAPSGTPCRAVPPCSVRQYGGHFLRDFARTILYKYPTRLTPQSTRLPRPSGGSRFPAHDTLNNTRMREICQRLASTLCACICNGFLWI